MKILELMYSLETAYELYGDVDIQLINIEEDDPSYAVTSCVIKKDKFLIGYNKDLGGGNHGNDR
jgi:hypothetical protein